MMRSLNMKPIQKILFAALCVLFLNIAARSQQIAYSEPEREDSRNVNFEIIGKVSGNIVVYKNNRSDNALSIYETDMKLKQRVKLKNLPDRIINADFIAYPDFFYMIYQHQKRNTVHCMGIKYDGNGQQVGDPVELDTTNIGAFTNNNKIYATIASENKQQIAIIKVNRRNEKLHQVATMHYNASLQLQSRQRINIPMENRNSFLTEFVVDNDGDIYLLRCHTNSNNENVSKLELIFKGASVDSFSTFALQNKEKVLDEVRMKMDNANKKVIISSFFYGKKKGNIEGLYTSYWTKTSRQQTVANLTTFTDSLRILAKGEASMKTAFNDFFINQIYPKKDGGFIIAAESSYSSSRGGNIWNRWDYINSYPYYTNFDYYNLGGRSWYWNNWDRWGNRQQTTYHNENVAIWSVNANGDADWSNIVYKDQTDENTDDFVSYQVLLTGGQLHFLFNLRERNTMLMYDHSLSPDGKVTRNPTLKNLDRQREIMPRHGKQVSSKQMVFPCFYKTYLCFARIEYQ
jgi:hypothetical protein